MFEGAIPQETLHTTGASFRDLGLSATVADAVDAIGFKHPTPIQAEVIPAALAGRDVIGLAQTGSGKTAAFCLPIVERLLRGDEATGLVLSPTREIALQTGAFLEALEKHLELRSAVLVGGLKIGPQIDSLRREPGIVVATPGRLLDHIERRTFLPGKVRDLILDEADHMLDLGFLPQVTDILDALPAERRTMLFSATMPPSIERFARRILEEPVWLDLRPEGRAAEGITHRLYLVAPEDKKACLLALLEKDEGSALVFMRRKVDADWASRQLEVAGHPVTRIHSDRSQRQRLEALQGFRTGEHRILVATDIAARGLDIPRIEHIINFDMPETVEDYIHRAGRTARGSLKGTVSSIATWKEKAFLRELEAVLGFEIPRAVARGVKPWEDLGTTRRRKKFRRRRLL